jgi:predicted Zn-dependent protease
MSTAVETQLDLAARVLDLVRPEAGTNVEAEVVVDRYELALTRFANSYIHQNVADARTGVRLRLHLDGRTASGSTTLQSSDGLRELVTRTVAAVRVCPPDPGWPGLAPPDPAAGTGNVDEATAAATPDERAAQVRAFVDAASRAGAGRELTTAGYCRTAHWTAAFANSAGQALSAGSTQASFDGIARVGGSDGVARLSSTRLSDLDGAVLGSRAAAKALAGAGAVELPPGRYEVVLEPTAVIDLLRMFALYGFNGKALAERRTFAELGVAQFDPGVTLVDDPLGPKAIGLPFDAEGTPKHRLALVDRGVTGGIAHDRRTAAEVGTSSTGHALPGESAFGAVPVNLLLEPSGPPATVSEVEGPPADSSVAALVAGVERGLLVTDHWYTRVLDPRTLIVTGLTRNGVWLIEHGEVTAPVQNFRFTQSYPQALGPGAVLGVGTLAVAQPADWGIGAMTGPALRLASWNFTGGASG